MIKYVANFLRKNVAPRRFELRSMPNFPLNQGPKGTMTGLHPDISEWISPLHHGAIIYFGV